MTDFAAIRTALDDRRTQLLALADAPDSPVDPVDRDHIQAYLGRQEVPVLPADFAVLLRRYASSCLSYAVIRKKLTGLIGAIPTEDTIGAALDRLYGTDRFATAETWSPAGLLTAVEAVQVREGWSESDLDSRTPKKRILAVLKDGARYLTDVCPNGDPEPFYARVRAAVARGPAAMWDFAETFAASIRMVGPALASDFLKNLGFADYVKIDHHFAKEFPALIADAPAAPKGQFIHSHRIAMELGVTPFYLDHLLYQWGRYQRYIAPEAGHGDADYSPPFSFEALGADIKAHIVNDIATLTWTYGLEGTASVFHAVFGLPLNALFEKAGYIPSYFGAMELLGEIAEDLDIARLPITHTFRHLYEYAFEQKWDQHSVPNHVRAHTDDVARHLPFAQHFVDRADYFVQVDSSLPEPGNRCAQTLQAARVRLRLEQGENAFSFGEIAALIGRQEKTLRNLVQTGVIRTYREDASVFIDVAASRYLMNYKNSGKPHPQLRPTVLYNSFPQEAREAVSVFTADCAAKGKEAAPQLAEWEIDPAEPENLAPHYCLANALKERGLLDRMTDGYHFFYTAHLRYGQA